MNKNIENHSKKEENEHLEELIDRNGITMYGEFVSSYFAWTGLNRQKIRASELNDITKQK